MLTPEEKQRIREEAYERAKAEAEAKQEVENKQANPVRQGCALLLGYELGTVLGPIILIVIIILMARSC